MPTPSRPQSLLDRYRHGAGAKRPDPTTLPKIQENPVTYSDGFEPGFIYAPSVTDPSKRLPTAESVQVPKTGSPFMRELVERRQNNPRVASEGVMVPADYKQLQYGTHFLEQMEQANAYNEAAGLPQLGGTPESWNKPIPFYATDNPDPKVTSHFRQDSRGASLLDKYAPSGVSKLFNPLQEALDSVRSWWNKEDSGVPAHVKLNPREARIVLNPMSSGDAFGEIRADELPYGKKFRTQMHEATHAGQLNMSPKETAASNGFAYANYPKGERFLQRIKEQDPTNYGFWEHETKPFEQLAYLSDVQGEVFRQNGRRQTTPEGMRKLLQQKVQLRGPRDTSMEANQQGNAGNLFNLLEKAKQVDPEYHGELLDWLSRVGPGVAIAAPASGSPSMA